MLYSDKRAGRLINRGLWRAALWLIERPAATAKHENEAGYWLQFSLIEFLCDLPEDARDSWAKARQCPDFDESMEGDFLRDRGLFLLHAGELDEAAQDFEDAREHHKTEDRQNVLLMCRARLEARRGNLGQACEFFSDANSSWERLIERGEHHTPQWVLNNRFHWFRTKVMKGEVDRVMAATIIRNDPSPLRKLRAAVIAYGGDRGVKFELWLARRHGR